MMESGKAEIEKQARGKRKHVENSPDRLLLRITIIVKIESKYSFFGLLNLLKIKKMKKLQSVSRHISWSVEGKGKAWSGITCKTRDIFLVHPRHATWNRLFYMAKENSVGELLLRLIIEFKSVVQSTLRENN